MQIALSQPAVILNLFQDNEPLPIILKQVQDNEMSDYFGSRRDAEIAESAELRSALRLISSAISASSAPLREPIVALRAGAAG